MSKRKLKVFLSHTPNDKTVVRKLYDRLNGEGWLDIWLAEEKLYPGQEGSQEIEMAVGVAESVIVCISKDSTTQQGSVQRELRLVLDAAQNMPQGTIFIIPIKLDECEPPFLLRALQFANYFKNDRERGYQRLLGSLRMRANGLGITTTELTPDRPKASAETDAATPEQPDQTGAGVSFGRDANNSAVFTGNNNQVTIYNLHSGIEQPPLQSQAPDQDRPIGEK